MTPTNQKAGIAAISPIYDAALFTSALELVERLIRSAALARALADADAAAPRRRLSVKAWRTGCLRQAGHDATLVQTLRSTLRERGAQYAGLVGYVEAMSKQIREGIWGGPPSELVPAPAVWNANREAAAAELALIGGAANVWTAIAVAVEDVYETSPAAFGDVDDSAEEARLRAAPKDRAEAALRDVQEVPVEMLVARAWRLGLALDPVEGLAQRLVDHGMNPPAVPRREPERVGEVADLVGWR